MSSHHLVSLPTPTEKVVDLNSKMIKLAFLVFVYTISAGYLQELASYDSFPSYDESVSPGWPLQINYGESRVLRTKPCAHRRNDIQTGEQWIPSFRSMVKKPLNNEPLKPQAMKNEKPGQKSKVHGNNTDIAGDESKVSDSLPAEPSSNKESNTDTNEASDIVNGPNRRSNTENRLNNSDDKSANEDYNCDIGLETEDYYDSEYRRQSFVPITTQTTVEIEQKVIKMLRDCINKKQKYIEDNINHPKEIPLAGSRRSMGDSGIDNVSNNNSKPHESDYDKHTPTDTIKNSTYAVENNTKDNLNASVPVADIVYKTKSFTLRPGKLFNELQHPAKVTGIANIPVSRRMPVENSRVCYACSTATNPSCWKPDSRTTIKYCNEDQNCVTKSFGVKNSLTVLRDCAKSCEDTGVTGIEPKYKACSVCYKDLCNSAAINSYSFVIIYIISAIKCTF